MGKGTSELQAVLEGIRSLSARLTACEKDLIRLSCVVAEVGGGPVWVDGAPLASSSDAPLAVAPVVKGKSRPRLGSGETQSARKAGRASLGVQRDAKDAA
jgi:hypothetical protein